MNDRDVEVLSRAPLFEALDEVNKAGTAVLLVEQFVHLALKHSKRAYVLGKGEVAVEGKSKDLLTTKEEFYWGIVKTRCPS